MNPSDEAMPTSPVLPRAVSTSQNNAERDPMAASDQRGAETAPDPVRTALADALEQSDWSNVSIGNKELLKGAISLLRAAPQPSAPPLGSREAWQWLGGQLRQGDPDWVAEATEPASSELSLAVMTGGMDVWTARGRQRAKPRDWIVRVEGEIYLLSEAAYAILSLGSAEGGAREALEPFARAANGKATVGQMDSFLIWQELTVGDLRRTRTALALPRPERAAPEVK